MSSLRQQITNRSLVLLLILGFIYLLIVGNYGYVMLLNPVEPDYVPENVVTRERPDPPRGKITDRHGNILATSIQRESLYANPRAIDEPWDVAGVLSQEIDRSAEEIYQRITSDGYFVWLARKLEPDVVRSIRELDLRGIGFQSEYERAYPQTIRSEVIKGMDNIGLAAQVLGFVGIDNQGLEGIELQYNDLLTDVDSADYEPGVDRTQQVSSPQVQLTIDQTIQYIVEEEIMDMAMRERPRNAMVVVMDPDNGDVLAMANWPSFDPNHYTETSSFSRQNRSISNPFEPGSTLKAMTLSSGLMEGAYQPETEFHCPSYIYLSQADHTLHCYAEHGDVNIPEIMIKSCNVGTVKAVDRVESGQFYRTLRQFGFGNVTGVRLPGEAEGTLRRPANWSALTKPSMAIGQGISTTALQLTSALSGLINDGVLMQPRMVRRTSRNGAETRNEPLRVRRVVSRDVSEKMRSYMGSVVSRGTGQRARSSQYDLGGKTGTAQKANLEEGGYYEDRVLASFIGFGPVESPELAVSVIIDEPQVSRYGGEVAAPLFKRIMNRSLSYMNRTGE